MLLSITFLAKSHRDLLNIEVVAQFALKRQSGLISLTPGFLSVIFPLPMAAQETEPRIGTGEKPKGPPWCITHNRPAGGCGMWLNEDLPKEKKCKIVPHRPKEERIGTIPTETDQFKGKLLQAPAKKQIPQSSRGPAAEALPHFLEHEPLEDLVAEIQKRRERGV